MFIYSAFGFSIQSDLPLLELSALDTLQPCEVSIRMVDGDPGLPVHNGSGSRWLQLNRTDALLYIEGVAIFRLCGGQDILVFPVEPVRESLLRLYLLGPVMAGLVYQRGLLPLHGGSARINEGAVAFLGAPGLGKSTLIATLYQRGYPVVADDLVAVWVEPNPPEVFPGFPQLKIEPAMAAALGARREALSPLDPLEAKLGWSVWDGFTPQQLPLLQIFILTAADDEGFELIPPQEAVIELVRHSYPTRSRLPGDARHFFQCSQLANHVPVLRLKRSHATSPENLVWLVEDAFRQLRTQPADTAKPVNPSGDEPHFGNLSLA